MKKYTLKAEIEFEAECDKCALGRLSNHFRHISLEPSQQMPENELHYTGKMDVVYVGEAEQKVEEVIAEKVEEPVPPTLGISVGDGAGARDHFGATAESLKPENNL